VTPDEASKMPPNDYSGALGPRTAAQTLAKLDGQQNRLAEADKERMRALFAAGLSRQDEALGRLMKRLEEAGRWDSTLFIVTGDVASGRRTLFMDGLDLDEDMLTLPLYVHFPGGAHAAVHVHEPTEVYDVTHTMLRALGVEPPKDMLGHDLSALAEGAVHDVQLIRVAALDDRFSARWGDVVLHGKIGSTVELCDLRVDPTCAYDRSDLYPRVAQALFRNLVAYHQQRSEVPERQPLTLDADNAGMLKIWGVY
jgi:arylsulfatase A-like enzyme